MLGMKTLLSGPSVRHHGEAGVMGGKPALLAATVAVAMGFMGQPAGSVSSPSRGAPTPVGPEACAANATMCSAFGGLCVGFDAAGTKGYCLESCRLGSPTVGAMKCHGRQDVTCEPFGSATAPSFGCMPLCLSDADCGTRKCDL